MTKYLIIGKNGQLGTEFVRQLTKNNFDFVAFDHHQLDVSDTYKIVELIEQIKPEIVINTSAYNQVDLAEKNYNLAYKTNGLGVNNLVFACKKYNSLIIHYSTDYVFDGKKDLGLYEENDLVNPLNEYGKSKYLGETFLDNYSNSLLFRTSWVFGEGLQNFIYKFLQWTKNNNTLKVSFNEISIPTSTKTIVDLTFRAIDSGLNGKFHLTNSGCCSRYEYAKYILKISNLSNIIEPVDIASFNLPAKRPGFSAMSNQKLSKELNYLIPEWSDVVKDYLSS
ncbi:MAG: dTDP-4-dehydrorhamnose reductase [Candidatus Sericytochromatia bacterium]|nr:dTDP-4-dehydrorhamnose reductase [Candidatus Sericytochromatia bacterium]